MRLPARFRSSDLFVRRARGIWENLFRNCREWTIHRHAEDRDSTHVKAHGSAAGGKGGPLFWRRQGAATARGRMRRFFSSWRIFSPARDLPQPGPEQLPGGMARELVNYDSWVFQLGVKRIFRPRLTGCCEGVFFLFWDFRNEQRRPGRLSSHHAQHLGTPHPRRHVHRGGGDRRRTNDLVAQGYGIGWPI